MRCFVSVSTWILKYVERNLLLFITYASDLPLRTNKFCSVLFGIFTDVWRCLCHKKTCIVNVNVNSYRASSQRTPLMCSMCQVLIKKKRLQCTTKTVNLHLRLTHVTVTYSVTVIHYCTDDCHLLIEHC